MTAIYHTPHASRAPLTSVGLNAPLGQLDAALDTVVLAGSGTETTVNGAGAASGQKVVPVASTTGFTIGDAILLVSPAGVTEAHTIASISAGVSVTTASNLVATFAAGSVVSRSPAELVLARGGFATLPLRLAGLAASLVYPQSYGAVGDGATDDTVALRAAFATGKHVGLMPGTTYLYSSRLILAAGQHLYGNGATLKRRAQVTTTTTTAITSGVTQTITVADASGLIVGMALSIKNGAAEDTSNREISSIVGNAVTVSTAFGITASGTTTVYTNHYGLWTTDDNRVYDLVMDGNKANYTYFRWQNTVEIEHSGDRAVFSGVYIHDAPGEGMVALGNYVTIENCTITDLNGNGIHFGTSVHMTVARCRVINANLNTIVGHADGGIIWSNDIAHATITDCYIQNAIAGIGSLDDVANSDVTVTGCTIRDCTYAFEGLVGVDREVGNIVFSNNRVYNSGSFEINQLVAGVAFFPNHFIVSGNLFSNTKIYIQRARWVTIADNTLEDAGDTAANEIRVTDSKHVLISGNTIIGGGYGIYLSGVLNENVRVTNNICMGQYNGAIRNDTVLTVKSLAIEGNTITNDGTAAASYLGILVRSGDVVRGSFVALTGGTAGIQAQDNAIVKDNIVRHGAATNSILLNGGTTTVCKNNETTVAVTNGGTNVVSDNIIIV